MKIKYDIKLMKYIALFENITRAKIKDCFEIDEQLVFVVMQNEISKAIGKKGANVRRIEDVLKRKIKIVEFNPQIETFLRSLIMPAKAKEIKKEGDIVIITGQDTSSKAMIIGRNAKNLRNYENILKRYFEISEIKVV